MPIFALDKGSLDEKSIIPRIFNHGFLKRADYPYGPSPRLKCAFICFYYAPCGADARGSAVIYARSAPRGIVPVAGCCHAGVQSVLRQGFFLPDEKYDPVFHGDPVDRIAVCRQLLFAAPHIVVDADIG